MGRLRLVLVVHGYWPLHPSILVIHVLDFERDSVDLRVLVISRVLGKPARRQNELQVHVLAQDYEVGIREEHDARVKHVFVRVTTINLESTIKGVRVASVLGSGVFDRLPELLVDQCVHARVLAESTRVLVECPRLAHLGIVFAADTTINRTFNAFSSLRDKVDDSTNWLDDGAEDALTKAFAKTGQSIFLGTFERLGDYS